MPNHTDREPCGICQRTDLHRPALVDLNAPGQPRRVCGLCITRLICETTGQVTVTIDAWALVGALA